MNSMKITSSDRNLISRMIARGEDIEKIVWAFKQDCELDGVKFDRDLLMATIEELSK